MAALEETWKECLFGKLFAVQSHQLLVNWAETELGGSLYLLFVELVLPNEELAFV